MTYAEIYDLLQTLEIPVAYDHFNTDKNVSPPFLTYRMVDPDTFKADGTTYYRPYNYEIELVTEKKDPALETRIEELLTMNHIPYDIEAEVWDEDERIYHNFYEI